MTRPFKTYDMTTAQIGDVVMSPTWRDHRGVVTLMNDMQRVVVWDDKTITLHPKDGLNMCVPPLAWLGNDPIYVGDVIYSTRSSKLQYVIVGKLPSGSIESDCGHDRVIIAVDQEGKINQSLLTFEMPKRVIEVNGKTFPEPERMPPERGTVYWVADLFKGTVIGRSWDDDKADIRAFNNGLVHLTAEAANAHLDALFSISATV